MCSFQVFSQLYLLHTWTRIPPLGSFTMHLLNYFPEVCNSKRNAKKTLTNEQERCFHHATSLEHQRLKCIHLLSLKCWHLQELLISYLQRPNFLVLPLQILTCSCLCRNFSLPPCTVLFPVWDISISGVWKRSSVFDSCHRRLKHTTVSNTTAWE